MGCEILFRKAKKIKHLRISGFLKGGFLILKEKKSV